MLVGAGLARPTRPTLLLVENGEVTGHLTGLGMRLHLAKLLGPRRAKKIVHLLAVESGARVQRAAGGISRRQVLGAGAAAGATSVFAMATPATAATAAPRGIAPVTARTAAALRSRPVFATLAPTWGKADFSKAVEFTYDGRQVAAVPHTADVLTFVDLTGPDDLAISLKIEGQGVAYYGPDGRHLATLEVMDGATKVVDSPAFQAHASFYFTICFTACIAATVGPDCLNACFAFASPGFANFFDQFKCLACAGGRGLTCARRCRS